MFQISHEIHYYDYFHRYYLKPFALQGNAFLFLLPKKKSYTNDILSLIKYQPLICSKSQPSTIYISNGNEFLMLKVKILIAQTSPNYKATPFFKETASAFFYKILMYPSCQGA